MWKQNRALHKNKGISVAKDIKLIITNASKCYEVKRREQATRQILYNLLRCELRYKLRYMLRYKLRRLLLAFVGKEASNRKL